MAVETDSTALAEKAPEARAIEAQLASVTALQRQVGAGGDEAFYWSSRARARGDVRGEVRDGHTVILHYHFLHIGTLHPMRTGLEKWNPLVGGGAPGVGARRPAAGADRRR